MDSGSSRVAVGALALAFLGAAFLSSAAVTGCGSSNSASPDGGTPTPDASMTGDAAQPDSGQTDSGLADAPSTDASDAGEMISQDAAAYDCGVVPPSGTQIVTTTDPVVLYGYGVTSDGYAFYEDSNTEILYAVPSTGGAPTSLGSVTSQRGTFYLNGGKGVLFLPAATNPVTEIAPLSAWTAASGPSVISQNAFAFDSFGNTYDITGDGSSIAYFSTTDGVTAVLTVSSADGKTQKSILPNIDLTNGNCFPLLRFAGNVLLADYCLNAAGADGGTPGLTFAAFAAPSFGQVTLATYPEPRSPQLTGTESLLSPTVVSPDGTEALLAVPSGGLGVYPLSGAAPTLIDPLGAPGGFLAPGALFTPEGNVLYATNNGQLRLYTLTSVDGGAPDAGADSSADDSGTEDAGADDGGSPANANPLILVSANVPGNLIAESGDGKWVQLGNGTPPITSVAFASATTAGALTSIWGQESAEAIGFSTDSTFVAFLANLPTNFGDNNFDLYAAHVSGGTASKVVTSAGGLQFTTGSRIVTNVNANATTGGADIEGLDISAPTVTKTLVTQADPNFFYDPTSNNVFYSWHCAPIGASGVWVAPSP